jgi:hypothetical protein
MNRIEVDQKSGKSPNSQRAIVATLYVLGLASLMWLHSGRSVSDESSAVPAPDQPASVAATSSYLHAPTSDPSLPSLEATFSRSDVEPADKAQAPTF